MLTQRLTVPHLIQFTPSKVPFKPQFDDYQIVGVFHDVLDSEHLTGTVQPQMYVSLWQIGLPFVGFAVHTAVDPIGVTPGIRAAIASASSGISINQLETMQQVVAVQQSIPIALECSSSAHSPGSRFFSPPWDLRGDGVRRGTARPRNRGAHGAWRNAPRSRHAHPSSGNAPGSARYCHRDGRSLRSWPCDAFHSLRCSVRGRGKPVGRRTLAVHCCTRGVPAAGSPIRSHRSGTGLARRVGLRWRFSCSRSPFRPRVHMGCSDGGYVYLAVGHRGPYLYEDPNLWIFDTVKETWTNLGAFEIHPDPDWDCIKPGWNPWFYDSRHLAFFSGSALYVVSPYGKNRRKLVDATHAGLAIPSPDGSMVAFITSTPRSKKGRP